MTSGFAHESTSADTIEWYTPPHIFDKLGVEFDLDPCAPLESEFRTVPAKRFLTQHDNGLLSPWHENENVFMNPPYGAEIKMWMNKFALHNNGIALVFARTDTKWFQDTVSFATAICFPRGRIQFIRSNGDESGMNAAAPSCFVAFGDANAEALSNSGLGMVVNGWMK